MAAVFLADFAPRWLSAPLSFLIELLAAVPSVVYGLWGLFVLAPFVRTAIGPALQKALGWTPLFSGPIYGVGLLTAGIILALMIVPTVTAISRDVIAAIPRDLREASMALGTTKWETAIRVVLPAARVGIFGACVLALGRALGETIAVTMVIGNRPEISASLFAPSYTLASVIANEFTEATTSIYISALIELGLILFVVSIVVNALARLMIWTRAADRRSDGAAVLRTCVWVARRAYGSLGVALALVCAALAAGALLAILGYVVVQGIGAINWSFLTQLPHPVGVPGGGVGNGILGTFIIIGIATGMAVPIGLLTGIYLALFGRGPIPEALRFLSDVLSGVPSIAIGLFAYAVLVAPLKHFSAFSASFAFMMLMLPLWCARPSRRYVRSRKRVREGALALGHVELPRDRAHRAADRACRRSSRRSCLRSRASPAKPRRCSLRPSAASFGNRIRIIPWRCFRCRSLRMRSRPIPIGRRRRGAGRSSYRRPFSS